MCGPRGSLYSRANHDGDQRRRDSRTDSSSRPKTSKSPPSDKKNAPLTNEEPNPAKVRTWTDRSKSFIVEADFLALKDGKINLHKMNGVKIAVPVSKMSIEDLESVERMTGVSLERTSHCQSSNATACRHSQYHRPRRPVHRLRG